jgi:hypothetical protein
MIPVHDAVGMRKRQRHQQFVHVIPNVYVCKCVCVCVCVCVYIHVYVCMYVCMYVYVHILVNTSAMISWCM